MEEEEEEEVDGSGSGSCPVEKFCNAGFLLPESG